MKIKDLIRYYVKNPSKLFFRIGKNSFLRLLNDEHYIKLLFKHNMGYPLNLTNPQSFNEKLNWLKLHDRKPIYKEMVDKYEAKKYVSSIIGEEYIIPTIGIWDKTDEIDFSKLPEQFVIKCTHDSGSVFVCHNKNKVEFKAIKKKLNQSLKKNYYWDGREWPYKDIKPRIIAEKYMSDNGKALNDYKFYTMNGKVHAVMIVTDRGETRTRADYFDREFNHLDFSWGYPNAEICPTKPTNFEQMILLAERLAKDTIELRVDFYLIKGNIYFGELTFFDGGGMKKFHPFEWDYRMGEWLKLPN